jgi:ABC-type lipoprotein export system ATPase subunit
MMTPANQAIISLAGVSRTYRTRAESIQAVRNVDLEVAPGEMVVIQGASGSGKSTLLSIMAGLELAEAGDVVVGERDLRSCSDEERAMLRLETVGVVFQDDLLIEEFTAAENVRLPCEARGLGRDAQAQADQWLSNVGLGGLGGRFPAELSGGQRQRVGIARALIGGRKILLADEPTGALDSVTSRSCLGLLRDLCDTERIAAVVCSHDRQAAEVADRLLTMTDGQLRTC